MKAAFIYRIQTKNLSSLLPAIRTAAGDDLPKTAPEQEFWEAAFIDKENVFNGNGTAMTSTSRRLTYYISDYKVGDFLGRAHIVDRQTKDAYMILEARGFDYKDFKNIALNVTTWN